MGVLVVLGFFVLIGFLVSRYLIYKEKKREEITTNVDRS